MVNLKYIENPFTQDYFDSFEYFRNEKLFYDCINRKTLVSDDVFENLGSSFYTFLITGDRGEWIGYVLFHNNNLIKGYLKTILIELRNLLFNLKMIILKDEILVMIDNLLERLDNNEFCDTVSLEGLNNKINSLKDICIEENQHLGTFFENYSSNISAYLNNFQSYFYLDIMISLPLNTKEEAIEATYYGFIREVYQKVDDLIKNSFTFSPIILTNTNSSLYLVDQGNQQEIKFLEKRYYI